MKIYTIRDIAQLAGVSVTTVSRVLNHRPDVNPVTRQKVEQVIRECHFVGNANARGLKQADGDVTAVILRGRDNPFLNTLAEALLQEASAQGLTCLTEYIDEAADEFETARRLSQEKRITGFIFVGGVIDERAHALDQMDIPMVFATQDTEGTLLERASSVSIDDRAMGRAVMEALLARGHRSIAIFGGNPAHHDALALRYRGAMEACQAAGIPSDAIHFVETRFSLAGAYQAMQAYWPGRKDTTAVFCMSDTVALGVIRALADAGMRVPEDVSVVGFDGTELGKYSCPRLSTVEQPAAQIAQHAAQALAALMADAADVRHITLPAALLLRESVQ